MADDLDAFFDEVSVAEEEAKRKSRKEVESGNGEIFNSEDDAKAEKNERPAKKSKLATLTPLVAGGGALVESTCAVVVAAKPALVAAPNVVASKPATTSALPALSAADSSVSVYAASAPPLPPPLPAGPPPPPLPSAASVVGSQIGPLIGPSYPPSSSAAAAIGPIAPPLQPPGQHPPPPPPPPPPPHHQQHSKKAYKRTAAGKHWEDTTLVQFPENDFRLFVGNLAKDIREDQLADAFRARYPSFAMARICRNKDDGKSRGYGFVSVMDPKDCARALREMDQTWLGSRPIKVRRSEWKDRDEKEVRKKERREKRRNKRHLY